MTVVLGILVGLLLCYVGYLKWKLKDEARDYQTVIELQHRELEKGRAMDEEDRQDHVVGLERCITLLEAQRQDAVLSLGLIAYRHRRSEPDLEEEARWNEALAGWTTTIVGIDEEIERYKSKLERFQCSFGEE